MLFILVVIVRARVRAPSKNPTAFIVRRSLLTPAELKILVLIERALPRRRVFAQVAMGALLEPKRGLKFVDAMSVRGRFAQKVCDYAIVDEVSGHVLAIVELDDRSHDHENDVNRDAMLAAGGYRVVRIKNNPWPSQQSVSAALQEFAEEGRAAA